MPLDGFPSARERAEQKTVEGCSVFDEVRAYLA